MILRLAKIDGLGSASYKERLRDAENERDVFIVNEKKSISLALHTPPNTQTFDKYLVAFFISFVDPWHCFPCFGLLYLGPFLIPPFGLDRFSKFVSKPTNDWVNRAAGFETLDKGKKQAHCLFFPPTFSNVAWGRHKHRCPLPANPGERL